VALSNTTLGMLLATINASIVLISLPAIFKRRPAPTPLQAGKRLVPAVDADGLHARHRGPGGPPSAGSATCFGRVKIYNLGFRRLHRHARSSCPLDPFTGAHGAALADRLARRAGDRRPRC